MTLDELKQFTGVKQGRRGQSEALVAARLLKSHETDAFNETIGKVEAAPSNINFAKDIRISSDDAK